jgi:predicted nucleotidyltransferase
MVRGYAKNPLYWLHGVLLAVGLGYAGHKARRWLLLLGWGLLYFFGYTLLGVSRYFWYYAPLVPVFVTLIGLGGEAVVKSLKDRWRLFRRLRSALGGLILLFLLFPQARDLWRLAHHPDPRVQIYRDVGLWLAENTPPEASVGTLEVGIIGYYARRRMVDFAGLIQPDVALQMLAYLFGSQANGTAGPQSDYDIALLVRQPSLALQARLAHEIGIILGTDRVDVVFLNRAPVELAYAVIVQGQLLYQRSVAERVEFEAKVLSLYADYLPILRRQREEILEDVGKEARVQRYREALGRTERTLAAMRTNPRTGARLERGDRV